MLCRWLGCARRHGRAGDLLGAPVSGHRIFDRPDLGSYLGRPGWECAGATPERVEAVYCRVWGSRGQQRRWPIRKRCCGRALLVRCIGGLHGSRFESAGQRAEWAGCSTTRPRVGRRWCGWCGEIGWPWFAGGLVRGCLSVVGVTVEVLRDRGDTSLVGGLIDDVRVVPASLSCRFSQLRSIHHHHRLRGDAAARLGMGSPGGIGGRSLRWRAVGLAGCES